MMMNQVLERSSSEDKKKPFVANCPYAREVQKSWFWIQKILYWLFADIVHL